MPQDKQDKKDKKSTIFKNTSYEVKVQEFTAEIVDNARRLQEIHQSQINGEDVTKLTET